MLEPAGLEMGIGIGKGEYVNIRRSVGARAEQVVNLLAAAGSFSGDKNGYIGGSRRGR